VGLEGDPSAIGPSEGARFRRALVGRIRPTV